MWPFGRESWPQYSNGAEMNLQVYSLCSYRTLCLFYGHNLQFPSNCPTRKPEFSFLMEPCSPDDVNSIWYLYILRICLLFSLTVFKYVSHCCFLHYYTINSKKEKWTVLSSFSVLFNWDAKLMQLWWAEEVAHCVKYLLIKYADLSLDPSTHIKSHLHA